MSVEIKILLTLRKITGAGISDCQMALEEGDNDIDKAIEILRKKGTLKAAKKAERETKEGTIAQAFSGDKKTGVMVQINCESDFVAKNNEFIEYAKTIAEAGLMNNAQNEFERTKEGLVLKIGENITFGKSVKIEGKYVSGYMHPNRKIGVLTSFSHAPSPEVASDISMHIAASNPSYIRPQDVEKNIIDKEKEIYRHQLQNEKKPEDIIEKIISGKLQNFYKENCLLLQEFIKDEHITIEQYLKKGNAGIPLEVTRFIRFSM